MNQRRWIEWGLLLGLGLGASLGCVINDPNGGGIGAAGGRCEPGEVCECSGIGSCDYECEGPACSFVCEGVGSCDFSCPEGGCDATCQGEGSCELDCPGGDCALTCQSTGSCELQRCEGDCELECQGTGDCRAAD